MPLSPDLIRSTYPLPAYNYRVSVGGEDARFSEVSGLMIEHESTTYRHGLSYREGEALLTDRLDKFIEVKFKRGVVLGQGMLEAWLAERSRETVEVGLCDQEGNVVVGWRLAEAVPIRLEASSFEASTNDVAIETLDVMAAGISLEFH